MKIEDFSIDMAKKVNFKLHANQLNIPVINGLQIMDDGDPQTILLAASKRFVEQVTSDGAVDKEPFLQRLESVITNTKKFMTENGCENVDNSFIFYKDYNNGVFDFKVYVCDVITPINGEKKVIRQFNAYFVEPKMMDFYQLSLSTGPFSYPTDQIKLGTIDLENDQITNTLDNMLKTVLDGLKYKN